MKPHRQFLALAPLLGLGLAANASAADRYWDGGTVNIATDGNGASTYVAGTWNTTLTNWDAGAAPHVAWNNANLDTAIFGGTYSTGTKIVDLGTDIIVNQIQVLTGSTGGNRYDFGAAGETASITFGGT